jgi:hypothetical protein
MSYPERNRHGQGVKSIRKISVHGRAATVWRDEHGRYAVTYDRGKSSVPPQSFDYHSQAVAIHIFTEQE